MTFGGPLLPLPWLLASATINVAHAFHLDRLYGTVEPSALAAR